MGQIQLFRLINEYEYPQFYHSTSAWRLWDMSIKLKPDGWIVTITRLHENSTQDENIIKFKYDEVNFMLAFTNMSYRLRVRDGYKEFF